MTKARSRGCKRPDKNPQAPEVGTKGYIRVLKRGCGGYQSNHPLDPVEYDCSHNYGWACDDCPFVIEKMMDKEAVWVKNLLEMQGPPREFKHPMEYWMSPSVATELYWMMSNEDIKAAVERSEKCVKSLPLELDSLTLLFKAS